MVMKENKIFPADTYLVVHKSILRDEDRKILNMLYQPVIGSVAVMLYFSLWSDLDQMSIMSEEYNHHHLLTNMHLSLDDIYVARTKLEAIGLMRSYVKTGDTNSYVYELYSPLSAHEFLNHPMLNIILYSNVGKVEYDHIVSYFKFPRINLSSYTDVSKSFDDVFDSHPLTSYELTNDDIRKYNKLKLNINSDFDFSFLESSFSSNFDIGKLLNKDVRILIINLSYLYKIDELNMVNIIKGCINERGTIDKDDLRKSCRNYYQFDHGGVLPTIVERTQPEYLKTPVGDNSNKAKLIYTFENISPYNFLKSRAKGSEPTRRDLKLVEDLTIDYGLNSGVVNVLLDYVLKINNNKLERNFVETIAGQWQRLKIETVEEAMDIAIKEHKKYNRSRSTISKNNSVATKEEKIPAWFDKNIKKEEIDEDEKNKLAEMLKEYQ